MDPSRSSRSIASASGWNVLGLLEALGKTVDRLRVVHRNQRAVDLEAHFIAPVVEQRPLTPSGPVFRRSDAGERRPRDRSSISLAFSSSPASFGSGQDFQHGRQGTYRCKDGRRGLRADLVVPVLSAAICSNAVIVFCRKAEVLRCRQTVCPSAAHDPGTWPVATMRACLRAAASRRLRAGWRRRREDQEAAAVTTSSAAQGPQTGCIAWTYSFFARVKASVLARARNNFPLRRLVRYVVVAERSPSWGRNRPR